MLRFSRLFGPGKPNSLPNIWKNVRKKRRKRKQKDGQHDSDSSDEEKPKNGGWFFDYENNVPPEGIKSDDEVEADYNWIIKYLNQVFLCLGKIPKACGTAKRDK